MTKVSYFVIVGGAKMSVVINEGRCGGDERSDVSGS